MINDRFDGVERRRTFEWEKCGASRLGTLARVRTLGLEYIT